MDETTIPVDTILYLSLYYLVNDLVHLSYPTIKLTSLNKWQYLMVRLELSKWAGPVGPGRKSPKNAGFEHKKLGPFKTGPF